MSRPDRIFVTGAGGQLASFIVEAFADREVVAHAHASLDITDAAAVRRAVEQVRPGAIVNCAAFNDVDGAEERPVDAFALNAFAVRTLARAAEEAGARLVHYSSDFVFDGTATSPYTEGDRPSPRSTYAASKLLGEWFALDAPGACVLRVESLFGTPPHWTGRRGTMDRLVDAMKQGQPVKVFTDRVVSPSYCPDVAAATRHLLDTDAPPGVYHCVNDGAATWQEVAQEAAAVLGLTPQLVPVTMSELKLRAARPLYCALSSRKLAAAGYEMRGWREALRRWLAGGWQRRTIR